MSASQGSVATPPSPRAYPLTRDQLNRTKFFGRDFFTFYDDMIFRIQTVFFSTFNNFINSDPAMMLVDISCWAMDLLSFYIDRRATEVYLATARTRGAISTQTRTLGYKMFGAVPATVDMDVTLEEAYPMVVTYPAGWQWQDQAGNTWESLTDLTFLPGDVGPKTVTIREGETKTQTFTSDGSINQRYDLDIADDRALSWESESVKVGAAAWTRYEFLPYEDVNAYEVDYNGKPPKVVFGDGITGNIPPLGANITVEYVETLGAAGRILADRIQGPVTPLVVAGTSIGQTVINENPSSGGDDAEDLLRAKALAPTVYKARQVNITRPDYIARATGYASSAYGVVSKAQAYTARSAAADVTLTTCLDQIRNGLLYYNGLLDTEVDGALEDLDTVLDSSGTGGYAAMVSANLAQLLLLVNEIDGYFDDLADSISDVLAAASVQESQLIALEEDLDDSVAAGHMTAPEHDQAQAKIDQIRTQKINIENYMGTFQSTVTNGKSKVVDALDEISDGQNNLDDVGTGLAAVRAHMDAAAGYSDALGTDVNDALDCIYNHVDYILSDDCKANLVVVPILSTDADGFYTAPTLSLMAAVQAYLETRKEVTQTVEVVDGSYYLVPAEITITLGVVRGYIGEEVVAVVDRNIRAILKKRAFGLNLYLSEIHDECNKVDGVDYSNVEITGPTTHLGPEGNLLVNERETITLGTLNIDYEISNPPE